MQRNKQAPAQKPPTSSPSLDKAVDRVKELLPKGKQFAAAVYLAAREKGVPADKLFEELRRRAAAAKKARSTPRAATAPSNWMARLEDSQDRQVAR
jgi:hypothetical protein